MHSVSKSSGTLTLSSVSLLILRVCLYAGIYMCLHIHYLILPVNTPSPLKAKAIFILSSISPTLCLPLIRQNNFFSKFKIGFTRLH